MLDPFRGSGSFYNNLPEPRRWCEIKEGRNFFEFREPVDWIISNPPYSTLPRVLQHSADVAAKGFAYLLLAHHFTAKRLALVERSGFGLTGMMVAKVSGWFGQCLFLTFERDKPSLVSSIPDNFGSTAPGAYIQRKERLLL